MLRTIKQNTTAEIEEKKSKFIANIYYVETEQEVKEYIKNIKKKYHDAKHNCFAYIINVEDGNNLKKFSDDGEPSGTAGAPILEILEKQKIENVLVIVTRYFGGILLGTGGLARAYSSVAKEALLKTEIVNKTRGFEVAIETDYKNFEQLKYLLEQNKIIINKLEYKENIEIMADIPNEKLYLLEQNPENGKNIIIKSKKISKKYVEI